MKTCPTCGTGYSDELSFCLQDGTKLPDGQTFDHTNRPTEVLRPDTNDNTDISTAETIVSGANTVAPPPKTYRMSAIEPASKMGCALTIGQVAAALVVVLGLGIAGIFFTTRNNDVARLEPAPPNQPPVTTANAMNSAANSVGGYSNTSSTPHPSATKGLPTPPPTSTTTSSTPKATPIAPTGTPQPTLLPNVKQQMVRGGVLNGKAISLPQPQYPPVARAVRASGPVRVQVILDESGRVINARAVNGPPLLRNAAEQAARSARFSPTLVGGQPTRVSGVIVYNFPP